MRSKIMSDNEIWLGGGGINLNRDDKNCSDLKIMFLLCLTATQTNANTTRDKNVIFHKKISQ